ncbi:SART-1 protein [Lophiotrema nucula]|uniref:SART-1 protein n=1 Tax=Lophiotrema nucula TaxID=690887 RepID=A0A6A5YLV9_9PLEO|nr:SART-1 protein [Lophiotrema nucula]
MADALSIDEANKIRIAMGMAPLPGGSAPAPSGPTFRAAKDDDDSDDEPASTVETRQAAAYDNWAKLQAESEAKKKKQAKLDAIKKEREKAQRSAKLEGKGLADAAEDEDDMAFLKSFKKRQKKAAKHDQYLKEQEERERQALEAMQYSESDLAGVKVGHQVDDFEDGEQILVLKDTAVDEDDEDELEAVALKEKERLQERLDSKKRKRAYDPNDQDEGGQGSILAQYDEEIEGKKRKAFTLDGQGRTVEELEKAAVDESGPKRVAFSLDILKDDTPANDYMDISDVKIKKPKKKKSKSSRRKHVEEDEDIFSFPVDDTAENGAMDVDETEDAVPKLRKKIFEGSFVDDDDLQATLAAQRQKALKSRKKMRPEDIARQMREEASATPDVQNTTEGDEEDGGLLIDETTEFVQNLRQESEEAEDNRQRRRATSARSSVGPNTPGNLGTGGSDEDGDVNMEPSGDHDDARPRPVSIDANATGIDAEETVDTSVAGTLKLLRQRNVIQQSSEGGISNKAYRDRENFLAAKKEAEEYAERFAKQQREKERDSARWGQMSAREREEWSRKNNTERDKIESRKMAEIYNKKYVPTFNLEYVDEHGRTMNSKEAFKQLSHQFHGKGSGNTKTQKQLDKIAAENKKMAESSLETSLSGGMSTALDQQSKKHKQAGVRLQ